MNRHFLLALLPTVLLVYSSVAVAQPAITTQEYKETRRFFRWRFTWNGVVPVPPPPPVVGTPFSPTGPIWRDPDATGPRFNILNDGSAVFFAQHQDGPHELDVDPAGFLSITFDAAGIPVLATFMRRGSDTATHQHTPTDHQDKSAVFAKRAAAGGPVDFIWQAIHVGNGDAIPKPEKNPTTGAPRAGARDSPLMTFDAATGRLSFTDATINSANLLGDESLDPAFASDPLIGATIRVTDFTLSGPQNGGFLFTGGTLSIFKDDRTFLTAEIPELLIDDEGLEPFGVNIFGPLGITDIDVPFDLSESPWLDHFLDFWGDQEQFPPELFGRTATPITDLIASGQSFTVSVSGYGPGFSTPEPSSLTLLGIGALTLLGYGWRRCRMTR